MPRKAGMPVADDLPSSGAKATSDDISYRDGPATESQSPYGNVIREARDRMGRIIAYETENRRLGNEDVRFLHGHQWPDIIRDQREEENRPVLTVNLLPQYVDQVVGESRQNRPQIRVRPVDDKGKQKLKNVAGTKDYEQSTVIEGLIRHIERATHADHAYDTAFRHMVENGRGSWRVTTEYVDDDVFEQDIHVRRIQNPWTVYWDPNSQEWDRSDAEYCFVSNQIPKEEFRRKYPKATTSDIGEGEGDWYDNWYTNEDVRIAEYMRRIPKIRHIYLLDDGRVIGEDDFEKIGDELKAAGIGVKKERKVKTHIVEWYLMTGSEILEGPKVWPGRYIPVVTAYGKELYVDGQIVYRGLIRHAIDAQRMYNYWRAAMTELVALAPKAPFIIADEQVEGYETLWDTAMSRNHPYLPYKHVDNAPMPQRTRHSEIPSGAVNEATFAREDVKATVGIYDPGIGKREASQSGIAIQRLQQSIETGTFEFHDNFNRAIEKTGKILVDLIPRIYDTDRVIRVRNWEESEDFVHINQVVLDEETGEEVVINDLSIGRYDVFVKAGPSYATQREQAIEGMVQLMQTVPEAAQLVLDKLAEFMEWPGSDEIAERFRMQGIRAGLIEPEADEEVPEPQPNPEAEAAMMEAQARQAEAEAKMVEAQARLAELQQGPGEPEGPPEDPAVVQAENDARMAEAEAKKASALAKIAEIEAAGNEERIRELIAESIVEFFEQSAKAANESEVAARSST